MNFFISFYYEEIVFYNHFEREISTQEEEVEFI